MASAELTRRVERWFGYPPMSEMGDGQRQEFQEALLDAAGGSGGRSGSRRCASWGCWAAGASTGSSALPRDRSRPLAQGETGCAVVKVSMLL